ncbi:Ribophorin I, partial [Papiliotrema laurentii]
IIPLSFLSVALAAALPPQNFVNTAIARTVELGGSVTHVTTQYNVKALVDGPGEYHLALGGDGDPEPAWWEVLIAGKPAEELEAADGSAPTVKVPLGDLKKGDSVTVSLNALQGHASVPLPNEIAQRDPQYLVWTSNSTYVDSWYPADVERIKVRSPTPNILSHSEVPSTYTRDNTVTKASSTITLGPFHALPATLGDGVERQSFNVHFETKEPVMGVRSLRRSAEVSHWGANLNIQDEVHLVNNGPKLKGHFSRLEHQQSRFHASKPAQILTDLTLRMPPSAHSAYYYDTIGNVSTSHFRQGSTPAQQAKSSKVRTSSRAVEGALELRPRYPLLGGWNYTFTVGWDMPLGDVLKVDGEKQVLGVPFLTGWKDILVDDAELKIILPEGARDVEVFTPFPVDSITHSTHKTYLDTTGRHAVTIKKSLATENHAQTIFVTYSYPLSAHLQKPLAVCAVVAGLFILGAGLRRVDMGIEKK